MTHRTATVSAGDGLSGQRVLLTRSADDCAAWAARLQKAGADPVSFPCIDIELGHSVQLREALSNALENADWLVLTSRRGVDAIVALGATSLIRETRIAVVGTSTAESTRNQLGSVAFVGTGGTAAALAHELLAADVVAAGHRCVLAIAGNAGPAMSEILSEGGAHCTRVDVYRTVPHKPNEAKTALSSLEVDAIVFASPTAVTGFINQVEVDGPCPAYSIGPSTSAALQAHGLPVTAEAREPNLDGIIATFVEPTHA